MGQCLSTEILKYISLFLRGGARRSQLSSKIEFTISLAKDHTLIRAGYVAENLCTG